MSAAHVYTLCDPRTMEVRYVGVTRFPELRARQHCKPAATRKGRWVQSLLAEGVKPHLAVVETADEEGWQAREQFWIREYRRLGARLTNGDDGGLNRLRHTEELKAKIARTLAGRPNTALSRRIYAYRKADGAFAAEHACGREAAAAVGGDRANIVRAARSGGAAYGFFWSYERAESLMPPNYAGGRYVATAAHRAALSSSSAGRQAGRKFSLETRAKMSAAAKRRHSQGASPCLA